MKIKRNVEVPQFIGREGRIGEISRTVLEFVDSEDANLKFECGDAREAQRVYSTVCNRVRTGNLPLRVSKSMNDIYVLHKVTK